MPTDEVPKPSGRRCKTCQTADPSLFYPTQKASYCRTHWNDRYINPGRARLLASKLDRKHCVDCRLQVSAHNAVCFDYDHLHSKTRNVGNMLTAPDAVFQAELAKCELVCANCHRLRTLKRGYTGGRPRRREAPPTPPSPDPSAPLGSHHATPHATDTRP